MNDYIPTPVPNAEQYKRYSQVQMPRAYGGAPYISYREEHVVKNETGESVTALGSVGTLITEENTNTEFTVIDPISKASTGGVMTYGELLQAIDSMYYHLAVLRDKEEAAEEEGVRPHGVRGPKVDKKL